GTYGKARLSEANCGGNHERHPERGSPPSFANCARNSSRAAEGGTSLFGQESGATLPISFRPGIRPGRSVGFRRTVSYCPGSTRAAFTEEEVVVRSRYRDRTSSCGGRDSVVCSFSP